MRIGLLSDVHGTLAALRAVVDDMALDIPLDRVVVAGDLLQGGPRPREVWELLVALGWTLVRGNEDEVLTCERPPLDSDFPYRTAYRQQHLWCRRVVGPEILAGVAMLPTSARIATPAGDVLIVHASPRDTDDRVGGVHNTADEVATAYSGTGAAAIAFGHYHRSFVRPTSFALLINVASVGLPFNGRPLAAYTILTAMNTGFIVEQRHVPYDLADEVATATEVGMPPWTPDLDSSHS